MRYFNLILEIANIWKLNFEHICRLWPFFFRNRSDIELSTINFQLSSMKSQWSRMFTNIFIVDADVSLFAKIVSNMKLNAAWCFEIENSNKNSHSLIIVGAYESGNKDVSCYSLATWAKWITFDWMMDWKWSYRSKFIKNISTSTVIQI